MKQKHSSRYTLNDPRILPRLILLLALLTIVLYSLVPFTRSVMGAETNVLYVYRQSPPATTQLIVNDLLTVKIVSYSRVEKSKGTATGTVTYPSDMLQVVNTDNSASEYQKISTTIGTGSIVFNGERSPSIVGIAQVFSITFKMIKAGTATVGFGQGSIVDSSTTTYLPGNFSISLPATTTSPTPTSTSAPSTTPSTPSSTSPSKSSSSSGGTSSSSSSTSQKTNQNNSSSQVNISSLPLADTTPLSSYVAATPDSSGLIDTVNADSQYTTSTISWKINANDATARIVYGISSSKQDKSTSVNKKSDGTYSSTLSLLSPGVRYYYTITATGGGKSDSTYSGVFITKGYPATFEITENNTPVQSGQITIGSQTYTVGTSGKKTIGLAAGRYSVTVTTNSASLSKDIAVAEKPIPIDGSAPENQVFTINLTSSLLDGGPGSGQSILTFIGIMVGGAVALAVGFAIFIAQRRKRFERESTSYGTGSSRVVIDDGYNWRKDDK